MSIDIEDEIGVGFDSWKRDKWHLNCRERFYLSLPVKCKNPKPSKIHALSNSKSWLKRDHFCFRTWIFMKTSRHPKTRDIRYLLQGKPPKITINLGEAGSQTDLASVTLACPACPACRNRFDLFPGGRNRIATCRNPQILVWSGMCDVSCNCFHDSICQFGGHPLLYAKNRYEPDHKIIPTFEWFD